MSKKRAWLRPGVVPKRARGEDSDLGERLTSSLLESPPSEVSRQLFCGAEWNVANETEVQRSNIGALVVLADEGPLMLPAHAAGWPCKHVVVADDADAPLSTNFDALTTFIDEQQNSGRSVLVLSPRGLSRGPTVCVAYLMKSRPMCLRDAYAAMRAARPTIKINAGFFEQLMAYEMHLRAVPEPSMSLQEYRRGLIKLWPSAVPQISGNSDMNSVDDESSDDTDDSDADVDDLGDPADVAVAESGPESAGDESDG